MGTMSNSEITGAALSIITNKKDESFAVNCLDSIDLALKIDDNLINFYVDSIYTCIALETTLGEAWKEDAPS